MPGWMKWGISLLVGFGIIVLGWRLGDNRWLHWLLPAFFVMNCLVLIIVVLLQSGKGGGFGGRIRRSGQPDGIRAARCGDNSFASDNVVRDYVHGLRDGAGFARGPHSEHGRIGDLQYDETGYNQTSDASTGYAGSGNDPCAEFIDACDATTAATGSGTGSADSEKVAFLVDSVAGNVRRS